MHEQLYLYFTARIPLSSDSFSSIARYFIPKTYKKGSLLLRPGEICRHNYFVNTGCLRFYSTNEFGDEFTRYFAFENKFGTDLTSFIAQKNSFEYIQALESTEVLSISRDDFFLLVDTVPEVNFIYRNILEMAYVTTQRRIYGLQGETALERLKWLINYQPDIFHRLSGRIIATYLGVSVYTLSRLKADL